jgi:hypothetical protein
VLESGTSVPEDQISDGGVSVPDAPEVEGDPPRDDAPVENDASVGESDASKENELSE